MVLWFFQISSNDCFSFTRENFTSHNRWEKAAAWFERQNWFLRLCPFPIYGTRWDKRSLFERGRNKSGSSWPFLKPKVSYSHKLLMPLSNHWYAARFLVVSTSVWLFVRSLFVFFNPFFRGSSHSSKAGRLGVSAKWSPSKRLFSMKVMRWPVSCLQILMSFFCRENFSRVI